MIQTLNIVKREREREQNTIFKIDTTACVFLHVPVWNLNKATLTSSK